MDIPLIRCARLTLLPFAERHLTDRYVSWLNDPEVVRFSEQRHSRHSVESSGAYAASFSGSSNSFIAMETELHGHIGNMTVTRDLPNRTADLAIMIGHRPAWGQGYAAEAWSAIMRHLLQSEKLRKVTAGTMAENHAMLKLMRRTGMKIEGHRSRQFVLDGREVDLVLAAAFSIS